MNNRLISFLKDTKVYKRIRLRTLRLHGSYKLEIHPFFLFLLQHIDGVFNRYDIVVRYMGIEHLEGESNSGMDMYEKMQVKRNEYVESLKKKKLKKKICILKKAGVFQNLIARFKEEGFNAKFPLIVNSGLQLVDGSHRLACALYFEQATIRVEKTLSYEVDYGLEWFETYFTAVEIKNIEFKYGEILKKIDLKSLLASALNREHQPFGRGKFYQSCEEIDLSGQRPTTKRYNIYRLDEHLDGNQDVLDIGCNCGFLTLLIAKKAKFVLGIEISDSLVQIGQATQAYLGRINVQFRQGNFNRMELAQKFDFIFSFAVHYWLGVDMKKFGKRLYDMLNLRGKILLESQNIEKEDLDWDSKVKSFMEAGFEEISNGSLKDDGIISRRFSLFQKIG